MLPVISTDDVRAAFGFPAEIVPDSVIGAAILWAGERLGSWIGEEPDPNVWGARLALALRLLAGAHVLRLCAAGTAAGPRQLTLAGQRIASDPGGAAALAESIESLVRALLAPLGPDAVPPLALLTDPRPANNGLPCAGT